MSYTSNLLYYKIKAVCSEKGKPLYDVEQSVGLTVGYLSRRKGRNLLRNGITIDCISAIADALKVDPDYILHYTNPFINEEEIIETLTKQTEAKRIVWEVKQDDWYNEYYEAEEAFRLMEDRLLIKGSDPIMFDDHPQSAARLSEAIEDSFLK